MSNTIKITVENDYGNYFENWSKELATELSKRNSDITEINVNSGPYRSCGLSYEKRDNILHLDFYSGVRSGFGSIGCTQTELADLLAGNEIPVS